MRRKYGKFILAALLVFLGSTMFFHKTDPADALTSAWINEKELGKLCVQHVVPTAKSAEESKQKDNDAIKSEGNEKDDKGEVKSGSEAGNKEKTNRKENKRNSEDEEKTVKVTGKPLVLIYHTHSTESYMPYSESNYHRESETGTVRDVGNVLEEELEKKGINVIHDKTIHDRPSYNDSYNRSLETAQSLMKKYPTAVYIIDLHRDAAAASAKEGKLLEIKGKKVAKFSMVVGQANENYVELYGFAKKISQKAEAMYDGFGGAIIEQNYNYNEFLSNRCLLLEIGNNKNTIEESRACAKYFAKVLAKIIKEEQ